MRKFVVYTKGAESDLDKEFVFVNFRCNAWAFFLHVVWLFFKKNWNYFLLVLVFLLVVKCAVIFNYLNGESGIAIVLVVKLILAFEAPFLIEQQLYRKGYELDSVIYGKNEQEARVKYFECVF